MEVEVMGVGMAGPHRGILFLHCRGNPGRFHERLAQHHVGVVCLSVEVTASIWFMFDLTCSRLLTCECQPVLQPLSEFEMLPLRGFMVSYDESTPKFQVDKVS